MQEWLSIRRADLPLIVTTIGTVTVLLAADLPGMIIRTVGDITLSYIVGISAAAAVGTAVGTAYGMVMRRLSCRHVYDSV